MPLTYDISIGIGAGFISWVLIKVVKGKMAEVHPLMWVVSVAFVVFFLQNWLEQLPAQIGRSTDHLTAVRPAPSAPAASFVLAGAGPRVPSRRCSNGRRCPTGRG